MKGEPKKIVLLGSTGSIGRSTLDVVRSLGGGIRVVGLAARSNVDLLVEQASEFKPEAVAVVDDDAAREFARRLPDVRLLGGEHALEDLASLPEADLVVVAVVGSAGIRPTLAAIDAGKDVALANKESLVAAGAIIVGRAKSKGVTIIPIDSEHSAVYQCLRGEEKSSVTRIILTASGGPFVDMGADEIESVTAQDALKHPTWQMGKKVTIDSATLLNKGFEVIEAHWLFGLEAERIEVVVERKSIVHSLVEFVDGSMIGLLSLPDMRLPIQFALTHPERVETTLPRIDLIRIGDLRFEKPDLERFPCLALAYEAARAGGTAPAVLSAADEVAVEAFLEGRIRFGDIYGILKKVVDSHRLESEPNLESIFEVDAWARKTTRAMIEKVE